MRYLLPILLLLSSCREDTAPTPDPYDASRIEGTWRSMTPVHPDWEYCFDAQGFMRQTLYGFGATLASIEYPYATRADTVRIGGDQHDPARSWKIRFECDSVVEVVNVTPGQVIFQRFWLKKQPG